MSRSAQVDVKESQRKSSFWTCISLMSSGVPASRRPGVASRIGKVRAVVDKQGVDPVWRSCGRMPQEVISAVSCGRLVQLYEDDRRDPLDCHQQVELALLGPPLDLAACRRSATRSVAETWRLHGQRRARPARLGEERVGIDRPVEHPWRDHADAAQPGCEGGRFSVTEGDASAHAAAPPAAVLPPRHVGMNP